MRSDPPRAPRAGRFHRRLLLAVAALIALVVPAAVAMNPVPLDWKHTVGDPSVVKTSKKYVVIATGAKVNRALSKDGKVWKWKSSALAQLPSWAKTSGGDIWAADLAKVGKQYVLYFAAPIKGMTSTSRCIGVATSTKANGQFYPVAGPPLVCPPKAKLNAEDPIIDVTATPTPTPTPTPTETPSLDPCSPSTTATASPTGSSTAPTGPPTTTTPPVPSDGTTSPSDGTTSPSDTDSPTHGPTDLPVCHTTAPPPPPQPTLPTIGAIDPSLFVDNDGTPYLLYKTDGIPSSIRILPLTSDGLHAATGALSKPLVTYSGVLENPVMINRGGSYYLFDSQGDYARCSYMTVWRSSPSLMDWSQAAAHQLLTRKKTKKLCGPGGADVLIQPKRVLMYFEAWTCKKSYKPCAKNFWAFHGKWNKQHGVRALYAASLGFSGGTPHVKKYLKGKKR